MEVLSEYCEENRRYCWYLRDGLVYCDIEVWQKGQGYKSIWLAKYMRYYHITKN